MVGLDPILQNYFSSAICPSPDRRSSEPSHPEKESANRDAIIELHFMWVETHKRAPRFPVVSQKRFAQLIFHVNARVTFAG